MSGIPVEVHWFPNYPDKFVTWNSEINLYQVKNTNDIDHHNHHYLDVSRDRPSSSAIYLDISNETTAILLAAESRYQYIRCVAPSYRNIGDPLLAVGLANGNVALCNFVPSTQNNIEYSPKQSRPCICLTWNENETNLLAIGHDRNRSDHGITIWDTEIGITKETTILRGLSETAHSLCWDKHLKILIAGMSHKHIKLLDLRQNNPAVTVNTRAVHGLSTAPNGKYLASYIDNVLTLWDIRNIEKPIATKQMAKNINNLRWCPTRLSTLSILQRDSPFIHLLDLHCPSIEMEIEPHSIKRTVAPFENKCTNNRNVTLSYISWHPNDTERVLVLSGSGIITDFKIQQRIAIAWDNSNLLWGSFGNNLKCLLGTSTSPSSPSELNFNPFEGLFQRQQSSITVTDANEYQQIQLQQQHKIFVDDIADLIRKRALNDYGLMSDIQKNGELIQENSSMLKDVWRQIAHMNRDDCLAGIKATLGIGNNITTINSTTATTPDLPTSSASRSEIIYITWIDFPNGKSLQAYRSEQRDFAQQLCGWTFDKHNRDSFNTFIEDLCNKKEFTRAACISCFQLKIRQAIEILGRGADSALELSNLRIAAIALSGLNFDKNAIWRTQCNLALTQIVEPHLRGLFAFLTAENDNYDIVLKEPSLSVSDRMAFACQYLSDSQLSEYVKWMIQKCIELGDLNGLLLTGATVEGIQLFQSYVDLTDDIQTIALLAIRFLPKELIDDQRVQYWITFYRDLLDTWELWEQRAHFDITMGQIRSPPKSARSVFLLCSFCGKSVSACLKEDSRMRATSTNINKLSSCPSCRKPLPRCSLCLLHMGTTTDISLESDYTHVSGWQSKPFSKWFSWCQTCRHGGHTEHLSQWFSKHLECPVASCSCKCFALDLQ